MNSLVVNGDVIQLRADGRLDNTNDWTPELAEVMAKNEGLTLTEQRWNVINTVREYYQEFNTSPILKLLQRELAKKFGKDSATDEALSALFPNGVQQQGSRLAGVPLAHLDAELDQSKRVQSAKSSNSNAKHFNDVFDFKGKAIQVFTSGNLVNLEDWNDDLAKVLAKKEGIELTDEHWIVLNFLRKFYFQYGVAPMVKILIKHMSEEFGKENVNKDRMYKLFPGGPAKQGSIIAGLPSPQGCIDD